MGLTVTHRWRWDFNAGCPGLLPRTKRISEFMNSDSFLGRGALYPSDVGRRLLESGQFPPDTATMRNSDESSLENTMSDL